MQAGAVPLLGRRLITKGQAVSGLNMAQPILCMFSVRSERLFWQRAAWSRGMVLLAGFASNVFKGGPNVTSLNVSRAVLSQNAVTYIKTDANRAAPSSTEEESGGGGLSAAAIAGGPKPWR